MDRDFWDQIKLPQQKKKRFFVTVEGKTVEVDLAKKLEVEKFGARYWTWQGEELIRKPRPKTEAVRYAQLKNVDRGYSLVDNHAYWPLARTGRGKDFTYE